MLVLVGTIAELLFFCYDFGITGRVTSVESYLVEFFFGGSDFIGIILGKILQLF